MLSELLSDLLVVVFFFLFWFHDIPKKKKKIGMKYIEARLHNSRFLFLNTAKFCRFHFYY